MEIFENNKDTIYNIVIALVVLAVGYCLYNNYIAKGEAYQGDANEGGGRGMTGRGLKGHRFLPNDYMKREENAYLK